MLDKYLRILEKKNLLEKFFFSDKNIFVFLFIYIVFVLFFVSPDSYTHDLFSRCDSAYFFMCGKAWMNGMVPYVDFSDSKGPLLWLIYGVGYLIDNNTYIGVFWISCLFYAITFYICYKIAFLLIKQPIKSLLSSMAMILPYFIFWFHYEIRAEDFCHPFVAIGIYFIVKASLDTKSDVYKTAGLGIGIGLVACFLIKWSVAVMYLSFVLSLLFLACRKHSSKDFLLGFVEGTSIMFFPFLLYFYLAGNFSDFIHEYLFVTVQTVKQPSHNLLRLYIDEWIIVLTSNRLIYIVYILAANIFLQKNKDVNLCMLFCILTFLGISIRHDIGYYTTILASFAIFLITYIVIHLNKYTSLLFSLIIFLFQLCCIYAQPNLFHNEENRKSYYIASYVMSQVKNPTIINEGYEIGIGLPAHTLPGTKYWSKQNGESKEMKESRLEAIKNHKADFITYQLKNKDNDIMFQDMLLKHGYVYYCQMENLNKKIKLFGKPGLVLPDSTFRVSNYDILLKRKIF